MVKALFDTNVLIDHLNGFEIATLTIARYRNRAVSLITWIEVMAGADLNNKDVVASVNALFVDFKIIPVSRAIGQEAVRIRKRHFRKLKLPDAIIKATANISGALLITRDIADFPPSPDVIVPYQLPTQR